MYITIHVLVYYVHYNTCTYVLCTLQYMYLCIMYITIHVLVYYVHYNTCTCVLCTLQYMYLCIMYMYIIINRVKFSCNYSNNNCSICNY